MISENLIHFYDNRAAKAKALSKSTDLYSLLAQVSYLAVAFSYHISQIIAFSKMNCFILLLAYKHIAILKK